MNFTSSCRCSLALRCAGTKKQIPPGSLAVEGLGCLSIKVYALRVPLRVPLSVPLRVPLTASFDGFMRASVFWRWDSTALQLEGKGV